MFVKRFFLPILAGLGALFGLFMVFYTTRKPPRARIPFPPPTPPFSSYLAGAGVIEAASENIAIGTPFNEIVEKVFVESGDIVPMGAPLFQLNTETLERQRNEAKARYEQVAVELEEQTVRLGLYERLRDTRAVSEDDYNTQLYAFEKKRAELFLAEESLLLFETNIARSTVRAPMRGEVLQVHLHPGENADQNPFRTTQSGLLLFGNVEDFHIRIDIDESDVWRYKKGSQACAFVRGNSAISIPLQYVRLEPYLISKQSLTGDNIERVDTRVLQVIYRFQKGSYPVYVGEVLDVYVETAPLEGK